VLIAPDNCNASYAGTPARRQSASQLIKQEIYFATQTFFGSVKKPAYAKATASQAPRFVADFGGRRRFVSCRRMRRADPNRTAFSPHHG